MIYNLRGQSHRAKQSTPQTAGYEIICGKGRNFKTVKYVDAADLAAALHPGIFTGSAFLNPITKSIKSTRGVNLTHTQATAPPGEGQWVYGINYEYNVKFNWRS